MGVWVAGSIGTIANSASVEVEVEVEAELGNIPNLNCQFNYFPCYQ